MENKVRMIKEGLPSTALERSGERESVFLRVLLCLTIACSTFQKTFWYVGGLRVLLSDVLMAGFCICCLLSPLLRRERPHRPAGGAFFLASVPVLFSMLISGLVNAFSGLDVGLYWKGVVSVCFALFFQVLAIKFIAQTTDKNQAYYPLSFIVGALISAGYSAAQVYFLVGRGIDLDAAVLEKIFSPAWHEGIEGYGSLYRISGLLADPNHFGVVIVAVLAITIGFLMRHRFGSPKLSKPFLLTAVLSFVITLVFTFSRTAFVALAMMLLVFVLLAGRLRRRAMLKAFVPLLALSVLGASILLYSQKDALLEVVSYKLDPSSASVVEHASLYSEGLSLWTRGPSTLLFGVGPNNFSAAYQRRFGVAGWNPHSSWVTELVEEGLLGFLGDSFLVFYIMRSSYLSFIRGKRYPALGLAYTAALSCVLAGSLFYDVFHWNYVFVLQALAVGLRERDVPRTATADCCAAQKPHASTKTGAESYLRSAVLRKNLQQGI
jgi:hypothetical protein